MIYSNIKEFFDKELNIKKFDKNLYDSLLQFKNNWITKNEDHLLFLNSGLLGAHKVVFKTSDEEEIINDILNNDREYLQKQLYKVKGINKDFKVTSNIFYNLMIYLVYNFINNSTLPKKDKTEAATLCMELFYYKVISSLLSRRFIYLLDKATATSIYESLNYKFLIKKYGTWDKLFKEKAKDVVDIKGLHFKRLLKYNKTEEWSYIISDSQLRIRDVVNNVFRVTVDFIKNGEILKSESLTHKDAEGELVVKELTDFDKSFINKVINLLDIKYDLIKPELILIIEKFNISSVKGDLKTILNYISSIEETKEKEHIKNIIETSLIYSMDYVKANPIIENIDKQNVVKIINVLKGFWNSSKVKEAKIKEIKLEGEKIVKKAINKSTRIRISSGRTNLFIYLFILSLL